MSMTVHCVFMLAAHSLININALTMCLTGIGQVEAKRDSHYDDLNEVIAKHSYGRHSIPVVLLLSPEEKYRARVAKQENVDALANSMMQFGSVNEHVEVVLFLPPNKPLPNEWVQGALDARRASSAGLRRVLHDRRGSYSARDELAAPALQVAAQHDDHVQPRAR